MTDTVDLVAVAKEFVGLYDERKKYLDCVSFSVLNFCCIAGPVHAMYITIEYTQICLIYLNENHSRCYL